MIAMKELTRSRRQAALDRLIEQARREERVARTMAHTGVRLFADREIEIAQVIEDIDELARATKRLQTLQSIMVLDLEEEE